MTVEDMKTGFVERIGGTIFVVNAMSAENAKHTQEELVKALIAKEAMALQGSGGCLIDFTHSYALWRFFKKYLKTT